MIAGRRRVAVTGIGVVCPAGTALAGFWETLLAGRSMAAPIEGFDASQHPVRFACEVRDFAVEKYLDVKEARRTDRVAQLGLAAAIEALADAGAPEVDPARCGVVGGTGVGGLQTLEQQEQVFLEKGAGRVSPFFVPMMMPNATAALISLKHGWTGPNFCVATACAAGSHSIGEGMRLIRDGSADLVLAGGTEAAVTPIAFAAFAKMGALSGRNDEPTRASRPFDVDRDGFVLGEGAGIMVLERAEFAAARGATVHGKIAGAGLTSDAYHITGPEPEGIGQSRAIRKAVETAGLSPKDVGHVNCHATSTVAGDVGETRAVRKALGDHVVLTAPKSQLGHTVGAAGAIESILTLLTVKEGIIPATLNLENLDPGIELDVVSGEPRKVDLQAAVCDSFGFGGHNAAIAITKA